MSVTTAQFPSQATAIRESSQAKHGLWLRSRQWDLIFITLSVLLVPTPYIFYIAGMQLGLADDFSRNLVNGVVAVLVGGPHMYATFMRTTFDKQFVGRYPMLVRSSLIIPVIVLSLAFLNLTLLLTVFFFWALIHVLHQASYIVELYNHRKDLQEGRKTDFFSPASLPSRLIDYAVIFSCMAPMAAYKISQGNFNVGANDLMAVIPHFFQATWFFVTLTTIFFISLVAFIVKTVIETRRGYIHWPKTLFITLTVVVSFFVPALPNLDTAFQGMNTWHSFQYLALTFYIVKLREERGELQNAAPLVHRYANDKDSRKLYLFSALMGIGSLILGVVLYGLVAVVDPSRSGTNEQFDIAYYCSILCFLWVHYYYDHFLFTDFEAIDA